MPYARAPLFMLVVIGVTLLGFWPSYFAVLGKAPWPFHAHGIAAGLWILMVTAQSLTARWRWFGPHHVIGRASLVLFPFLIAGLAAIIDLTGKSYVAGDDPVRALYGGAFLIGLLIAVAAYVVLFYGALRQRRKVWLHAGYMLATPLILWESPFSRVLNGVVPALAITGPRDFPNIISAILWADLSALVFCLALRWRVGPRAQPFALAAGFIAAQMAAMAYLGSAQPVLALLTLLGRMPSALVIATGFAIGAATSWMGWQAGKAGARPAPRMARLA